MNNIYATVSIFILTFLMFGSQLHAQSPRFTLLTEAQKTISGNSVSTNMLPKNPLIQAIVAPIPKAYCYDDLAIFCKLEVKLEQRFKFPVKIRLGEVNYVEMLEGKPHDAMMNGQWLMMNN